MKHYAHRYPGSSTPRSITDHSISLSGLAQRLHQRTAQSPGIARMTAVGMLARVGELTDATGGSVDAVMEATWIHIEIPAEWARCPVWRAYGYSAASEGGGNRSISEIPG